MISRLGRSWKRRRLAPRRPAPLSPTLGVGVQQLRFAQKSRASHGDELFLLYGGNFLTFDGENVRENHLVNPVLYGRHARYRRLGASLGDQHAQKYDKASAKFRRLAAL